MDNVDIERKAVRAVGDYIDSCPQMRSYIADNDRTPIWDGDIFVYSNDDKTNGTSFAIGCHALQFADCIHYLFRGTCYLFP